MIRITNVLSLCEKRKDYERGSLGNEDWLADVSLDSDFRVRR